MPIFPTAPVHFTIAPYGLEGQVNLIRLAGIAHESFLVCVLSFNHHNDNTLFMCSPDSGDSVKRNRLPKYGI